MYDRLYKYSIKTLIIKNSFVFAQGHSTDHVILQLVHQIQNNSEQNNFTLGVFVA